MGLQLFRIHVREVRRTLPLREDLRRQHQIADGREPQVGDRVLDAHHGLAQAKKRRIGDLQHLARDRGIRIDDVADFGGRHIGPRQGVLQAAVGLGHGGQLADAADDFAQRLLTQQILQIETALDDVFQLQAIAGFWRRIDGPGRSV